ncbi:MAG: hypothetical protein DRN17_06225 [Thermoplasmata archaeon]|nr:MAG: hypothetical protein DRN17_06225 [Thermoplasmata archaeon]
MRTYQIPLFFTLFLVSLLAVTSFAFCDSENEVRIVVLTENMTLEIVGKDIDTLIINGYDLKSLVSAINKLDFNQRYLENIVYKQSSKLNEIVSALNATIVRVNNNTYLILRNRRDIVLLALALNKTTTKVSEMESTLNWVITRLDTLQGNLTQQAKLLSDTILIVHNNYEDLTNLAQEVKLLVPRIQQLENLCKTYENELYETRMKMQKLQDCIIGLSVMVLILAVILLKLVWRGRK